MGTAIAGQKVQGMCINGTVVNGACQNGVKFYEKATVSVPLTNLIDNGSFESNTMSWTGSVIMNQVASTPGHGEVGAAYAQISQSTNQNGTFYFTQSFTVTITNGHKYYIRGIVRDSGANLNCQLYNNAAALTPSISTTLTSNTWQVIDGIWTSNTTSFRLRFQFGASTNGNATRTQSLDNVMMINLTTSFGAGQEPTLEVIREAVIAAGGWWDRAKTISV